MNLPKLLLSCVISLFVFALPFVQATAAPSSSAHSSLFVAVPPVQVSNYLKTSNSRQIVRPYLWVNSKKAGEVVCHWMPRVRDAFFTALNSPAQNMTARGQNTTRINAALTSAVYRAVPRNLVAGVIAFDANDPKAYRAERKLKGKMHCPNKTKGKSKKKSKKKK